MASAAHVGNVAVAHRGLGIAGGEDLVRAAVAVLAICRRRLAGLGRLRMQAV